MGYYTGARAKQYETRRKRQSKWRFEQRAMRAILDELRNEIESVIDAPVGTGRFLGLYRAPVFGLDLSQDMLDIAATKSAAVSVRLEQHDLAQPLPERADLVVCVRLLNLIDRTAAERVLDNLFSASQKYVAMTLRALPNGGPDVRIGRVYAHRESLLADTLKRHRFKVLRCFHFKDKVPGNYDLILCQRIVK